MGFVLSQKKKELKLPDGPTSTICGLAQQKLSPIVMNMVTRGESLNRGLSSVTDRI